MQSWLQTRVCQELGQEYGMQLWRDQQEIIRLYAFYEGPGQMWPTSVGMDYTPNKTLVNHTKRLIGKVAGFMFGRSPEITLQPIGDEEANARRVAELEQHVRNILEANRWHKRLLDAGRDCFVGKRVALKVAARNGKIIIRFRPSVEFFHDVTLDDEEQLSRIIFAYGMNECKEPENQRIWVQSWRMEQGHCLLREGVYNGYGTAMSEEIRDADTGLDSLPAYVILNEGMTSDVLGNSDVQQVEKLQNNYNRLVSDDMDALKFNMFPQTVFTDASEESMAAVKISPGALLDLQTDPAKPDAQAKVAKLESSFQYSQRYQQSKDDLLKDMYALESCPQVTEEYLKTAGISGKAIRAMYWDLQCRCEERWAEWDSALQWLVRQIVIQEKAAGICDWTGCDFTIKIEHLYPITDDEDEERKLDMQEVNAQVRSRRSYLDKWQPDADADGELRQMALERQQLEEASYGMEAGAGFRLV